MIIARTRVWTSQSLKECRIRPVRCAKRGRVEYPAPLSVSDKNERTFREATRNHTNHRHQRFVFFRVASWTVFFN